MIDFFWINSRVFYAGLDRIFWEARIMFYSSKSLFLAGRQYIAVAIGTPTIHANLWVGAVNDFLGGGDNVVSRLQRKGPALQVFALD